MWITRIKRTTGGVILTWELDDICTRLPDPLTLTVTPNGPNQDIVNVNGGVAPYRWSIFNYSLYSTPVDNGGVYNNLPPANSGTPVRQWYDIQVYDSFNQIAFIQYAK